MQPKLNNFSFFSNLTVKSQKGFNFLLSTIHMFCHLLHLDQSQKKRRNVTSIISIAESSRIIKSKKFFFLPTLALPFAFFEFNKIIKKCKRLTQINDSIFLPSLKFCFSFFSFFRRQKHCSLLKQTFFISFFFFGVFQM